MPALAEVLRGLYGSWRLLMLDRHGILAYDGTRSAALRSFWVALLSLPLAVAANAIPLPGEAGVARRGIGLILADCTLSWLLPLIVIYGLVRWYGRRERYWLLLTALNWSQVPQALLALLATGLFAAAGFMTGSHPQETDSPSALVALVFGQLAMLVYLGAVLYEWFVAWITLDAGIALPTAVVLFDLVIGYAVGAGLDHLGQVFGASG